MMKTIRNVLAVAFLTAPQIWAQSPQRRSTPAGEEELRSISRRGQLLAQYDRISWLATDALVATHPDSQRLGTYIPRRSGDDWVVVFGRLNAARDTLLIAYEARLTSGDSLFRVTKFTPAHGDTSYFLRAARALDVGQQAFGKLDRPYNTAVLPTDDQRWWVYMYPAQTRSDVWPLGGDERFLISADGKQLIERRQMHKTIIEYSAKSGVEAYTHTAVVDDVPEDTDVFTVLSRRPLAPEFVVTNEFVYRLGVEGGITFLGRREDILNNKARSP